MKNWHGAARGLSPKADSHQSRGAVILLDNCPINLQPADSFPWFDFNPQGPRGPRHEAQVDYYTEYIFQSTRPSRASTAISTNFSQLFFSFLSIMLHFSHSTPLPIQKAPIFYALFPAFSSANIPTFPCPLHIRTKKSTVLPHQIQALPLYAPPYFCIGFPDYKISGCLYLYQ